MTTKPRLFIGSSSEGLPVAEALQRNLWRVAEATLWSQGVFAPSRGGLESILNQLDNQDFGLFVFSPDDVVHIRETANSAVRDNVLFELGIFIGRLGRERCYFLVPDGFGDELRIPTDLAGITPLAYEHQRTDRNLVAATGAACAEVKAQISLLGARIRAPSDTTGSAPTATITADSESSESRTEAAATQGAEAPRASNREADSFDRKWKWFDAYRDRDFKGAAELLERRIAEETDIEEKKDLIAWQARAIYRFEPARGERLLNEAIEASPDHLSAYTHLAYAYLLQDLRPEAAMAVVDRWLQRAGTTEPGPLLIKADALKAIQGVPAAISFLNSQILEDSPEDLYLKIAALCEEVADHDGARRALDLGTRRLPTSRKLLQQFADLLEGHFDKKLALIPRNALVALDPKDATMITLRANVYLMLDLHDTAMREYERANDLANAKEGWILGNIGNLFNFKGLFTAGIQFLNQGLALEPTSEYMHERLARALKSRSEEDSKLAELDKEARLGLTTLRANDLALKEAAPIVKNVDSTPA